ERGRTLTRHPPCSPALTVVRREAKMNRTRFVICDLRALIQQAAHGPVLFTCCALLAISSPSMAQTAAGVIRGSVQDATGAIVPDVHLLLADEDTNRMREQTTNEWGLFDFSALPFGNYRIQADRPGFMRAVVEHVTLQVAQTIDVTLTLQLGSVTESIAVLA